MEYGDIVKTALKKYSKKMSAKTREMMLDNIVAVMQNVKPAFLVDISSLSLEELTEIVTEISFDLEDSARLNLICLGEQDRVIYNVGNCLKWLADSNSRVFVDVSHDLEAPRLCFSEDVEAIKDMIEAVVKALNREAVTFLQPQKGWNMTTLFGIFLGYPVVYFYKDLDECKNCLAGVELSVNQLKLKKSTVSSFSYPTSLEQEVLPALQSWTHNVLLNGHCSFEQSTITLNTIVL